LASNLGSSVSPVSRWSAMERDYNGSLLASITRDHGSP
jgi:hypothetical protein